MTGSSRRGALLTGFARGLAASALLMAVSASAQDAETPAGPVSILPAPPDAPPAPQEPVVAVGDLAAPGVDRIGVVDIASGGFPAQLWDGTDLELLRIVMPQLPHRVISPAQRRLTQNLLLSPGIAPTALTPGAENDTGLTASQWLLEMRVAALARTGDWPDVQAVLELAPADQLTEGLQRIKTEAALVTNHISAACAQTQAALNVTPDPYWQKVQVFCQMATEQSSAASLGLGLLREQKVDDPMFYWAVDVLGGGTPPLPATFTRLEPLHFAMLRKANAAMPANIAAVQSKVVDPASLAWLAALPPPDPSADKPDKTPEKVKRDRRRAMEDARILLAERAVAAGTLDVAALREIYSTLDIKDPAPPPLTQITASDVRGRALLFQSAQLQTEHRARAEVIALALDLVRADRGKNGPGLMVMGRLYAPLILEIEPSADHVWFAGTAVRALLAAATTEQGAAAARGGAKAWFDLARDMARSTREAEQIAHDLWPLNKITAGVTEQVSPEILRAWTTAQPVTLSATALAERRALLLSLLTGLGETVTAAEWLMLMAGPAKQEEARPLSAHLWNGMALAAKNRRVGEAVLLSLVALGEDGPGKATPPTLQHVIESLRAIGREGDARALAVEAALVSGL
jgi:hypothetical protein